MPHVLILGGTGEALALARALALHRPDLAVTTSLAGATSTPVQPPGAVRIGGFGGSEGLGDWLHQAEVAAVVDATHPFAATMAGHAAAACTACGIPRLKLVRPMWQRRDGDRWIAVADAAAAAQALVTLGARRVFLTLGTRELRAFAGLDSMVFTVRMIEAPAEPLPLARADLILARGPFGEREEYALIAGRRIDAVVAKASGGDATRGKIDAARALGLPVVMIARPQMPPGPTVDEPAAVLAWLSQRLPG